MVTPDMDDDSELRSLAAKALAGDATAWNTIIQRFHPRLRRMVALRLDHRLAGRVDPSDVIQETYIDAVQHLPEYLKEAKYPFFLWLRLLTGHRLAKIHRYHLGAQVRDVSREVPLWQGTMPSASSMALAEDLLGTSDSPDLAVQKMEQQERIRMALEDLDETDREVLTLRHFEQMTSTEAATILGISPEAAGKRYLRALGRLKIIMKDFPPPHGS